MRCWRDRILRRVPHFLTRFRANARQNWSREVRATMDDKCCKRPARWSAGNGLAKERHCATTDVSQEADPCYWLVTQPQGARGTPSKNPAGTYRRSRAQRELRHAVLRSARKEGHLGSTAGTKSEIQPGMADRPSGGDGSCSAASGFSATGVGSSSCSVRRVASSSGDGVTRGGGRLQG